MAEGGVERYDSAPMPGKYSDGLLAKQRARKLVEYDWYMMRANRVVEIGTSIR